MNPGRMWCVVLAMLCVLGSTVHAIENQARPNVVIIVSDDQGWGDLSVTGNRDLATPHIDSLARDGATLDRFYVCPVCSPTRAEMLTGRYHQRGGVFHTSAGGERLDLDEHTIAAAFARAGYATGCFGKWHNGMQYPYHPRGRGFGEFFGFASGHWGQYFDAEFEHDGKYIKADGYCTDLFTDRAIGFIERYKDKPFFCYLPFCTPHSPMQVPDKYWAKFASVDLRMKHGRADAHTRCALAMCENIDWNVGRVLAALDKHGLTDNTIVIYLSDNGPNGPRWNGSMRGRKGSTDEGGVRVPCLVRYPARIKPGLTLKPITAAIDLLPTLCAFAGIDRVGSKPLDGIDVSPLLTDPSTPMPDRMIFSHWNGRISVRTQRHRLDHKGQLYDMAVDPGQTRDIAKDQPAIAKRLRSAVAEFRKQMSAESSGPRPFTVGHADWPTTELPARDARFAGSIERSNKYPNCSYLRQWTSTDDRITFDVDVLTAGRYEAVVEYACPKADVGSTVELAFNGATVRGKIITPHDPPLIGASDDRSPRGESLVKDFKLLSLGVIDLPAGRGTMTLRATDVPGSQVAEFRRLTLIRVPRK